MSSTKTTNYGVIELYEQSRNLSAFKEYASATCIKEFNLDKLLNRRVEFVLTPIPQLGAPNKN